MTWTKLGSEYADQCADVDLSDAAFRTHTEALAYLYKIERYDCTFNKAAVRRFATSSAAASAITELVDHGFWNDHGSRYEVCHHADVVQDSLDAQNAKRDRDKAAQQRAREKKAKAAENSGSEPGVSDRVSADTRQTDRQTGKHLEASGYQLCPHGVPEGSKPDSYFTNGMSCSACARERKSA